MHIPVLTHVNQGLIGAFKALESTFIDILGL
jgi:hypothetical protein